MYFLRFEPSFYTGFAPRCQDPRRISTYLGRGNQLRVTVVISDEMIAEYLSDLASRYETYRELIDAGQIRLSQNRAFEEFEDIIVKKKILSLARQRGTMSEQAYRKLSLETLQELNPGRVFHIEIDFERRMKEWSQQLTGLHEARLALERNLDIVNDMLPTRSKISELSLEACGKLHTVIETYNLFEKANIREHGSSFTRRGRISLSR